MNILPGIMFMHTLWARRPWPIEARRGRWVSQSWNYIRTRSFNLLTTRSSTSNTQVSSREKQQSQKKGSPKLTTLLSKVSVYCSRGRTHSDHLRLDSYKRGWPVSMHCGNGLQPQGQSRMMTLKIWVPAPGPDCPQESW